MLNGSSSPVKTSFADATIWTFKMLKVDDLAPGKGEKCFYCLLLGFFYWQIHAEQAQIQSLENW
jgi:hypothetical protein